MTGNEQGTIEWIDGAAAAGTLYVEDLRAGRDALLNNSFASGDSIVQSKIADWSYILDNLENYPEIRSRGTWNSTNQDGGGSWSGIPGSETPGIPGSGAGGMFASMFGDTSPALLIGGGLLLWFFFGRKK